MSTQAGRWRLTRCSIIIRLPLPATHARDRRLGQRHYGSLRHNTHPVYRMPLLTRLIEVGHTTLMLHAFADTLVPEVGGPPLQDGFSRFNFSCPPGRLQVTCGDLHGVLVKAKTLTQVLWPSGWQPQNRRGRWGSRVLCHGPS